MGRLQSEIAATQKEIEFAKRDLESLYGSFGEQIAALHHTFSLSFCTEEFHSYNRSLEDLRKAQSQLDHFSALMREADDHRRKMGDLKNTLKDLGRQRDEVFARAGAIAFEAAWAGSLPSHMEPLLPPLDAQQRSIAHFRSIVDASQKEITTRNRGLRSLPARFKAHYARLKLDALGRGNSRLFHETGKKLYDMECIIDLPSPRTEEILRHINSLDGKTAAVKEELETSRIRLDKVQGALSGEQNTAGEPARRMQSLKHDRDACQTQVTLQARLYGKALCRSADVWLPHVPLPDSVVTVLDQIFKHERRLSRLEERIVELEVDIEVEEMEIMIARDSERVVHLKNQIDSFQRQVEDILGEIDTKKQRIDYLRTAGLAERKIQALAAPQQEDSIQ